MGSSTQRFGEEQSEEQKSDGVCSSILRYLKAIKTVAIGSSGCDGSICKAPTPGVITPGNVQPNPFSSAESISESVEEFESVNDSFNFPTMEEVAEFCKNNPAMVCSTAAYFPEEWLSKFLKEFRIKDKNIYAVNQVLRAGLLYFYANIPLKESLPIPAVIWFLTTVMGKIKKNGEEIPAHNASLAAAALVIPYVIYTVGLQPLALGFATGFVSKKLAERCYKFASDHSPSFFSMKKTAKMLTSLGEEFAGRFKM